MKATGALMCWIMLSIGMVVVSPAWAAGDVKQRSGILQQADQKNRQVVIDGVRYLVPTDVVMEHKGKRMSWAELPVGYRVVVEVKSELGWGGEKVIAKLQVALP